MALKDTQNRTIVFDISESAYDMYMSDTKVADQLIREAFQDHPELFPPQMNTSYVLNKHYSDFFIW